MNAIGGRRWVWGLGLVCLLCSGAVAQKKGGAVTDPKDADADFAFQGEYAGKRGEMAAGAHVVALGGGKFDLVAYAGGLPGAGWKAGDPREKATGALADGVVTFKSNALSATLKDGLLTLADGSLKKTERVSPTLGAKPPAGAVVLFDGEKNEFNPGTMTPEKLLQVGQNTKYSFQGSYTLHVEFRTPYQPTARGQGRGNSGVYVMGKHEVQVLDSFGLEGKNNECGGLYGNKDPLVNMCLPPLAWQTYDIDWEAPQAGPDGKPVPAKLTVRHNGVVIHDKVALDNTTKGGLNLQNHGNPVVFRNLWVLNKQ